jgi:hypothetical protein
MSVDLRRCAFGQACKNALRGLPVWIPIKIQIVEFT